MKNERGILWFQVDRFPNVCYSCINSEYIFYVHFENSIFFYFPFHRNVPVINNSIKQNEGTLHD